MLMQVATAHMLYVYRDAYRHAVALLVVSGDQRTDPEHLATLLQCARTAWTAASSRPYAHAAAGARKHPRARPCQASLMCALLANVITGAVLVPIIRP